ncbi:hypothetical protein UPYG_G00256910 [Umbra pygmaea]|uniref:Uncharacterized protein n=1 Tax=Umbra pygmaea TaxID=75934 RepID=A0ABD0W8L6_UMBPY
MRLSTLRNACRNLPTPPVTQPHTRVRVFGLADRSLPVCHTSNHQLLLRAASSTSGTNSAEIAFKFGKQTKKTGPGYENTIRENVQRAKEEMVALQSTHPALKPTLAIIQAGEDDCLLEINKKMAGKVGLNLTQICLPKECTEDEKHVIASSQPGEDVRHSVEQCFYVDNCLQSLPTEEEASNLVTKLRAILATGGFNICQWASNQQEVICNLPKEAKSGSSERCFIQIHGEAQEMTLGLSWHFMENTLHYSHRLVAPSQTPMQNIYKTHASQYDPFGYILPFTTRAKVLVQRLWVKDRDWDDLHLPADLLEDWTTWEEELPQLPTVSLSLSYFPPNIEVSALTLELPSLVMHQGSLPMGQLLIIGEDSQAFESNVAFMLQRGSKVAPKKQQSMPH